MSLISSAKSGDGVFLSLADANGEAQFFFPYDYSCDEILCASEISSDLLLSVSVWLAENRYLPSSDGKGIVGDERL